MNIHKQIATAIRKRLNPALGMKGFPPNVRSRNANGALRRVRGDKLLGTVRDQFRLSKNAFAGHSDRMQVGTLRKKRGVDSEKDLLRGLFGLKGGRTTNNNGRIRAKRGDTHLGTIRKQYGRSQEAFAGHSDRMHLETLEKKRGVSSIREILGNVFGLKGGRKVNGNGQIRAKRGDTHVGTLEKQYGVDFGVRSDMHLSTLRKKLGVDSIRGLLNAVR